MKSTGFRYVALVLGLLLLVTGGLKIHAAFSDKPIESYFFHSRWELLGIAEIEFFLGGWLITGVYSRLARRCALMTFFCFLAVSLLTTFSGERSCSCFGALQASPWIAATIDFIALIALFLCELSANPSTNAFPLLWNAFLVVYPVPLLTRTRPPNHVLDASDSFERSPALWEVFRCPKSSLLHPSDPPRDPGPLHANSGWIEWHASLPPA